MSKSLTELGYIEVEAIRNDMNYPGPERFARGPVAIIECLQDIPCNPCRDACPHEAILLSGLTERPRLVEDRCTGCGLCIAACPGQAIFVVDRSGEDGLVTFPYEYLPLPVRGMAVTAVDRAGQPVCEGTVTRVVDTQKMNRTRLVTIRVPGDKVDEVRFIRIPGEGE